MALICQTDSRIANASGTWQQNCNIDVTGYAIDAEFIIATYQLSDSVNPDGDSKLQWRRSGGEFADVAADTEVCWGTNTVLVNDGEVQNPAGCLATVDDDQESEGDNLSSCLNIKNGDYCEIQWALGFGSGAIGAQEYEIQLVQIDWSNDAVLQTTITTAAVSSSTPSSTPSSTESSTPSSTPSSTESSTPSTTPTPSYP